MCVCVCVCVWGGGGLIRGGKSVSSACHRPPPWFWYLVVCHVLRLPKGKSTLVGFPCCWMQTGGSLVASERGLKISISDTSQDYLYLSLFFIWLLVSRVHLNQSQVSPPILLPLHTSPSLKCHISCSLSLSLSRSLCLSLSPRPLWSNNLWQLLEDVFSLSPLFSVTDRASQVWSSTRIPMCTWWTPVPPGLLSCPGWARGSGEQGWHRTCCSCWWAWRCVAWPSKPASSTVSTSSNLWVYELCKVSFNGGHNSFFAYFESHWLHKVSFRFTALLTIQLLIILKWLFTRFFRQNWNSFISWLSWNHTLIWYTNVIYYWGQMLMRKTLKYVSLNHKCHETCVRDEEVLFKWVLLIKLNLQDRTATTFTT